MPKESRQGAIQCNAMKITA